MNSTIKSPFNKIAFFTENDFEGYVPRNHVNMRTEFAWMVALNAYHHKLGTYPKEKFDLGIVITSKTKPELTDIKELKKHCDQVAIMQEGPFWYFQDYDMQHQVNYYNNLALADIVFCHNEVDKFYFKGLLQNKPVFKLQSLMIEDAVVDVCPPEQRSGVMIGGNFVSWYGGFDSWRLAKYFTDDIYMPSMGRHQKGEEGIGIKKIPFTLWSGFIKELSKRKLGIHMMRTHAAGTFALNCSYLGIPCIGYKGLDTQSTLHPDLSFDDGDLYRASRSLNRLWNDVDFYNHCANVTKENYQKHYTEEWFLKNFNTSTRIWKDIINGKS
jgi:hypothetical protein